MFVSASLHPQWCRIGARYHRPNQEAMMPIGLLVLIPLIAVLVLILRRVGPPGGDRPHRPPPCCTVRELPQDSPPPA